jgi:hypothetical protein
MTKKEFLKKIKDMPDNAQVFQVDSDWGDIKVESIEYYKSSNQIVIRPYE